MKKYIQEKQGTRMIKGIGISTAVSLAVMLMLTGVLSAILIRGVLAEEYGRIFQIMIHSIAVVIGCLLNDITSNGKILISNIAVGMSYTLVCVILNALMFGADYHNCFLTLISVIAGIAVAILLCIGKQIRGKRKYHL